MPQRNNREYRMMPVMTQPEERAEQRLATDYYVEGYATTFGQPYLLWDDGNEKFYEQIARNAFDEADMTDVIFQHNHEGKCFARTKMRADKAPTLILEPQDRGLFVAADLGMIAEGREEWAAIKGGLVYQMSFAFTVADDEITMIGEDEYLRTIKSIRKVYDVSSVDAPANPNTLIDTPARAAFDGFIEQRRQELQRAEEEANAKLKALARIRILAES